MSCNGCRVLRKGCTENCILRPCLEWIQNPQAQGYATLFLSKFFGRSDLMSFISSVPENKRSALFQSLLFEACGRTVNPVNGAVGLLATGNWHICRAAVETVLDGGIPRAMIGEEMAARTSGRGSGSGVGVAFGVAAPHQVSPMYMPLMHGTNGVVFNDATRQTVSFFSGVSEMSPSENDVNGVGNTNKEPKLLNLF